MTEINRRDALKQLQEIALAAGKAILEVYESDDFGVETKNEDGYLSPLTRADKTANDIIVEGLQKVSDLPIVSEENTTREVSGNFWLVDPLDGTKEFVKRNGEFTVNIALVQDNQPLLGVVYAPVLDVYYIGDVSAKSAVKIENGTLASITAQHHAMPPVIVTSRSHKDERTEKLLGGIGEYSERSMGSSLKLCLVAEGAAMLYPRLGPTSLWDTAAADAVVTAAGGAVKQLSGEPLVYEPSKQILNPEFIVEAGNNTINWQAYLA